MKIDDIRKIIELVDQSSIHEFTYETEDQKIKLKKREIETEIAVSHQESQSVQAQTRAEHISNETVESVEDESVQVQLEEATYDYEIVSPMVGTIYHAPSPESDPYVTIGSKITKDTTVCIVEAMKLFNEIEAEVDGEIVEILVENGELVEYGQPLFRVKTT